MNVFLFPGQGSQEIGMGADLFRADAAFRELVAFAGECAGTDLARICLRGPERELVKTENLQPLLVAVALGYYRKVIEAGIEPGIVLGHSLGEIAALAAAGVFTPAEAVRVAARRGALMGAAAAQNPGGMLAVLCPERDRVLPVVSGLLATGRFCVANDNAPHQLLFSGAAAELAEAARLLGAAKLGPCKKLPVSGPWHSPLMLPARNEFAAWLDTVPFAPPRLPILMNVSARPESDPQTLRQLVARNLTEPVQWRRSMDHLKRPQPSRLYEIGPGRVLAGLARANGFGAETRVYTVGNLRAVGGALKG